jgi:transcriptional regulator with XRE-family HTH domain
MITGAQVRSARALLKWKLPELARRSGVSESSIWRIEQVDDVPSMKADNLAKIERALEAAGIELVSGARGVGVILRR